MSWSHKPKIKIDYRERFYSIGVGGDPQIFFDGLTGEHVMFTKAVVMVVMILFAPGVSLAQESRSATSIENLNLADIADDSIVVLSKDESGISGVVNVKYAYVNSICSGGVQLVDYYGSEFDLNDRSLRRSEVQRCSEDLHDSRDGE